jgi:hypothetical protein
MSNLIHALLIFWTLLGGVFITAYAINWAVEKLYGDEE